MPNAPFTRKGIARRKRPSPIGTNAKAPAQNITGPHQLMERQLLGQLRETQLGACRIKAIANMAEGLAPQPKRHNMGHHVGRNLTVLGIRGNVDRTGKEWELGTEVLDGSRRGFALRENAHAHLIALARRNRDGEPIGESRYAKKKESHSGAL